MLPTGMREEGQKALICQYVYVTCLFRRKIYSLILACHILASDRHRLTLKEVLGLWHLGRAQAELETQVTAVQ